MLFGDIHTSVSVCKLKFIRLSIKFINTGLEKSE